MIKYIEDSDFYILVELYHKMLISYGKAISVSSSTWALLNEINNHTRILVGAYNKNKLVGFIIGYEKDSTTFYFSNIYILPEYKLLVKKLMDFAEKEISKRGYKKWLATGITKQGIKILRHYGARKYNG